MKHNKAPLNPFSTVTQLSRSNPGSSLSEAMKFKEGSVVEVLKRKDQCDSWFPGKIISADRYKYTVRYDLFRNCERDPVVEEVFKEDVRPYPPPVKGGERWMVGDIAEVFDLHCWRIGKVVKVLNSNRFVIRLSGSIQLKEFQRSNIRVRQTWQNNKWVLIEKVGEWINNNLTRTTSKYSQGRNCVSPEHNIHEEAGTRENGGQEHRKTFSPVRTLKRKHGCNSISSLRESAMGGGVNEKKTSIKAGKCDMLPAKTPLLKQVDSVSSPKRKMGKKCMIRSEMDVETKKTNNLHPFSMPVRATIESNECSVASCSSNSPLEDTIQHIQKSSDSSGSSFDDAESLCVSKSGRKKHLASYGVVELEADVHTLELHAYKSTMKALYASGPLSWEQESLLTNLRLSLHISNEEHLLQLKNLLSSQVL